MCCAVEIKVPVKQNSVKLYWMKDKHKMDYSSNQITYQLIDNRKIEIEKNSLLPV